MLAEATQTLLDDPDCGHKDACQRWSAARIGAFCVEQDMKRNCFTAQKRPRESFQEGVCSVRDVYRNDRQLQADVRSHLRPFEALKSSCQRFKRLKADRLNAASNDLPIFQAALNGERFLLEQPDPTILIYVTDDDLLKVARSRLIVADGVSKYCPKEFYEKRKCSSTSQGASVYLSILHI